MQGDPGPEPREASSERWPGCTARPQIVLPSSTLHPTP